MTFLQELDVRQREVGVAIIATKHENTIEEEQQPWQKA